MGVWSVLGGMSLPVGPEAEHREASNSCTRIKNDLAACMQASCCSYPINNLMDFLLINDYGVLPCTVLCRFIRCSSFFYCFFFLIDVLYEFLLLCLLCRIPLV